MQPPPVPTLYLHGANDGAIGADLLGDLGPYLPAGGSAAEIVGDVGHFLHLEKPEFIAAKIGDWLGGGRD
ncbi:MAG: alpha/beta hydrolase [Mycobacterium sp.]|uniref:alpha/beta fold hydrolase n=1 Tax=Mycobacterium sp. TaxID=1785 RepID=UPI003C30F713